MITKGVLLCGGKGTRLLPWTKIANKHLALVWDKPMVLYPLETLKSLGVTDVLLVTGGEHVGGFADFLGDGSAYGVNLTYKVQKEAGGIAEALSLAEDFVGQEQFAVILGDNIFGEPIEPPPNCGLVLKEVHDPQRFGVYHNHTIEEKPKVPKSNLAVTGLYFYTPEVFKFIKTLTPSARGELEITSVNNWCLDNLPTATTEYKGFWSDAGTFDSLARSSRWAEMRSKSEGVDLLRTKQTND